MQTIYLDISNKGVSPIVYAKQGDVGRRFQVVLTDSGLPYVPASGSAFSVWYSGASGEGNYTDIGDKSAFNVSGNKVVVEMISQMLSNDGNGVLSIVLNDPNGNQISTWNIPYICEYVPGADGEEAKAYYTAFSQAVENLPYPDASLSVPGKAADAAAVGASLAGKAPAVEAVNNPGCFYRLVQGVTEWLNPPMTLGVEYRTTERHNGKVVYRKALALGALPNASRGHYRWYIDKNATVVGATMHGEKRVSEGTTTNLDEQYNGNIFIEPADNTIMATATPWTNGNDWYMDIRTSRDLTYLVNTWGEMRYTKE